MSTTHPRYDGHADSCDASRGEFADAAGRELLELLGAGPGGCLDLGCGTGINLPHLADAGWSVTGVDISADQLRLARRRVGDEIELVQADATRLPFDDGAFDAVASALLHTDVDDLRAVWREAARVLKPGGRLAYVGTHPASSGRSPATHATSRRSCISDTASTVVDDRGSGHRRRNPQSRGRIAATRSARRGAARCPEVAVSYFSLPPSEPPMSDAELAIAAMRSVSPIIWQRENAHLIFHGPTTRG